MSSKPRHRRSPQHHTVHTKDPRYYVPVYNRGSKVMQYPNSGHESTFNETPSDFQSKNPPFQYIMRETFSHLHVYELTPEQMKKDPTGYRFIVGVGAMSHTAFRTEAGLIQWMHERGLDPKSTIRPGEIINLDGVYHRVSFQGTQRDLDKYAHHIGAKQIRVLDNGEYVRGYSHKTKEGVEILYMNPNFKREVLPYSYS